SRSYGLAVARLAGLPSEVLDRAGERLVNLENGSLNVSGAPRLARSKSRPARPDPQLSLFAPLDNGLVEEIRRLDMDNLTPLEALNKLAELKRLTE
ncbi:MAG: DNA mismatch repair protein MutS, partial [Deltaproteobacteria bacterium]|nr:DNA mismatch repair protein MutS [Deltaproteobacteria bacterium]